MKTMGFRQAWRWTMDVLFFLSVFFVLFYLSAQWLGNNGFLHPKIVVFPIDVIGKSSESQTREDTALLLSSRLKGIESVYGQDFKLLLDQAIETNIVFDDIVPLTRSDAAISPYSVVVISPVSIGPITFSPTEILFSIAFWITDRIGLFPSTIIRGQINFTDLTYSIYTSGRANDLYNGKIRTVDDISAVIDEISHRVSFAAWDIPPEANWRSFQSLTHSKEKLRTFLTKTSDYDHVAIIEDLRQAVSLAPDWVHPKLQLAVELYMTYDFYRLEEAADLFWFIQIFSTSESDKRVASIGEMLALSRLMAKAAENCDVVRRKLPRMLDLVSNLNKQPSAWGKGNDADGRDFALATGQLTLSELLSKHRCSTTAQQVAGKQKRALQDIDIDPFGLIDSAELLLAALMKRNLSPSVVSNLGLAKSFKARLALDANSKGGQPQTEDTKMLLEDAIRLRVQASQVDAAPYVNAAISSDWLRIAALEESEGKQIKAAKEALDMLYRMAAVGSSAERQYARYRISDLCFSLGRWEDAFVWLRDAFEIETKSLALRANRSKRKKMNYVEIAPWISLDDVTLEAIAIEKKKNDPISVFPLMVIAELASKLNMTSARDEMFQLAEQRLTDNTVWRGAIPSIRLKILRGILFERENSWIRSGSRDGVQTNSNNLHGLSGDIEPVYIDDLLHQRDLAEYAVQIGRLDELEKIVQRMVNADAPAAIEMAKFYRNILDERKKEGVE